jgi:hypothetical protein
MEDSRGEVVRIRIRTPDEGEQVLREVVLLAKVPPTHSDNSMTGRNLRRSDRHDGRRPAGSEESGRTHNRFTNPRGERTIRA